MRSGWKEDPLALDYFPSGVPASIVFEFSLNTLEDVLRLSTTTNADKIAEVCFIGLAAYFEAFCKDHAASIINIAPTLIENLRQAGYDTRIDAQVALEFGARYPHTVGSLLMERYDFGTAKKINVVFENLLNITPFSKNDIKRYDSFLRDRNLLVHHGGLFTSKYLEQIGPWRERIADAYFNSLVVTPEMLKKSISFLERVARKLCEASHKALSECLNALFPSRAL
jgi:hypothetical protein